MKVSIIGAGHVGSTLALKIISEDLADVALVDINEDISLAKSLDLQDAGGVLGSKSSIYKGDDYDDIKESEIIVVTAGFPRKPGLDREDLLKKNAKVVKEVTENIKKHAPGSIIIMVTNPLDVMTYLCLKKGGFKKSKVMGMAGIVDSARLKVAIASILNKKPHDIETMILGTHGDSMVPLKSCTKIEGKDWSEFMNDEKLEEAFDEARNEGSRIVSLLKGGSAYFAPAMSIYKMIDIILNNKKETVPVSCYLDGEYNLDDVCLGVPVKLGKKGIEEIVEIKLTDKESRSLSEAAQLIKSNISKAT